MSSKTPQPPGDDLAEANTELRIATGLQDTIAASVEPREPRDPPEPDDPFEDEDTILAEHAGGVVRTRWARGSALAEQPQANRLGNYRVVSPLSVGRSGVLHLGEHALLRYRVAVKILPPPLRGTVELEARLLAEAVTMARVSHPGVPTVLDFGHDAAGSAYLVTEYLDGETLAAGLARGARFSLGQVIELGAQSAAALAAAHASGVVHRDLQPDCIHVCAAPEMAAGFRVKLVNFSSAGPVAESASYLAPEATWPEAAADPRADVYSLGCVLFELLTGVTPFVGSAEQVVNARRQLDPPPPRAFRGDLPPELDHLVHRMIARDPAHRPASMGEVESVLRAITQPPSRGPAPITRPIAALLAGVVVGLLIGFLLLNV
jgi:eukaryotic-like serine/threonine-protein kinase